MCACWESPGERMSAEWFKHWQELKRNAIKSNLVIMQHCLDCAIDNSGVNCAAYSADVILFEAIFIFLEKERTCTVIHSCRLWNCLTESFQITYLLFNEEILSVPHHYIYFTHARQRQCCFMRSFFEIGLYRDRRSIIPKLLPVDRDW